MVLKRYREILVEDGHELDIPWNAEQVNIRHLSSYVNGWVTVVSWIEPAEPVRKPNPIPEYEDILREIEENTVVCDLCKQTFVSMNGEHLCPNCEHIADQIAAEHEGVQA